MSFEQKVADVLQDKTIASLEDRVKLASSLYDELEKVEKCIVAFSHRAFGVVEVGAGDKHVEIARCSSHHDADKLIDSLKESITRYTQSYRDFLKLQIDAALDGRFTKTPSSCAFWDESLNRRGLL